MTILTADSIEQFLSSIAANGMSPNTVRAYRSDLNKLLRETGPLETLEDLNQKAAESLTKWRTTAAPKTIGRHLGAFRSFGEHFGLDVLPHYHAPTPADPEPHPLPEGIPGVMELLYGIDHAQGRALVALCGLCGLRVGEARSVTPPDAYEKPDGWRVLVRGKGARERRVPLSVNALGFVAPARAHALRIGTGTLVDLPDRTARELIAKTGVAVLGRPIASHDLRATFATEVYKNSGHDIRLVQRLLGHSDIKTTQVYIGHADEDMRGAVEGL